MGQIKFGLKTNLPPKVILSINMSILTEISAEISPKFHNNGEYHRDILLKLIFQPILIALIFRTLHICKLNNILIALILRALHIFTIKWYKTRTMIGCKQREVEGSYNVMLRLLVCHWGLSVKKCSGNVSFKSMNSKR